MIYQITNKKGTQFSAYHNYKLDLQKWERESVRRLVLMKVDFAENKNNKNFIFNSRNYPLRPRPTFTKQTKLWKI